MAMIVDPNNHPDHYNSKLQRHVMNKRMEQPRLLRVQRRWKDYRSVNTKMFTENPEDKRWYQSNIESLSAYGSNVKESYEH